LRQSLTPLVKRIQIKPHRGTREYPRAEARGMDTDSPSPEGAAQIVAMAFPPFQGSFGFSICLMLLNKSSYYRYKTCPF